ncbi:LysR substrate-binding domain-containing protein [Streptomyces hokutonensis]|uniref:LysR substrate-binding domain-containing protein n=1 Tax=Streptomyces hokutonensis TaxID=1306990 RepID=UPI0033C768B1
MLLGQLSLRLRVGAFQAPSLHLLPPALTALRRQHPDADVSVEDLLSEHGVEEIAAGRLDVAVVASWDALPDPPPRVAVQNESGVTLRIPMTRHRPGRGSPSSSVCVPGRPRATSSMVGIGGNLLDPASRREKGILNRLGRQVTEES